MAAGMHHAVVLRSKGQTGLLLNRKCVHICAERNLLSRFSSVQICQNTVPGYSGPDLETTNRLQFFPDLFRRFHFVTTDLRLLVKRSANTDQLRLDMLCLL